MSNRYEIREQIGKGGLGAVYKAFDTQLHREVAIKRVLSPDKATEEEVKDSADKLIAEAQTLSSLNHPNIITVFDVGQDEKGGFVVMELLKGETLDDTISRGVLTQEDFTEVVYQTLEALIAAQANNVIHRDIKPTNIMVIWQASGKFQLKILDFGLAKFSKTPSVQTMDQEESVMGSIFFMAPEQFERGELDARTDLYQMGCVYYNALTGQYPFNGETAPQVMNAHLQHRVIPLDQVRPDLSPSICQWVMWMINRDIQHRPRDAREALSRWPRNPEPPGVRPVEELPVEAAPRVSTGEVTVVKVVRRASAPPSLIVSNRTGSAPLAGATGRLQGGAGHTGPLGRGGVRGNVRKSEGNGKLKWIVMGAIAAVVGGLVVTSLIGKSNERKKVNRILSLSAMENPTGEVSDIGLAVSLLSEGDTSASVREQATKVLATLEGNGISEEVHRQMRETPAIPMKIRLAQALAERNYPPAVPDMLEVFKSAASDEQRVLVLNALRALAESKDIPVLLAALQGEHTVPVRAALEETVLTVLRKGGDRAKVIDDLLKKTGSASGGERTSIFRILGSVGGERVRSRLAEIGKGSDAALRRDAVGAYLNWPDRTVLADVEALIASAEGEEAVRSAAQQAYIRLSTLPGPELVAERVPIWSTAFGFVSRADSARDLFEAVLDFPYPETQALVKEWEKHPNYGAQAKGYSASLAQRIKNLAELKPNQQLAGNQGRPRGKARAAIDSGLRSLTNWVSSDTWFSWQFKAAESGEFFVEIGQAYLNEQASDFVVYLAGSTLQGQSKATNTLRDFRTLRLGDPVTLEAGKTYVLLVAAGQNIQPRMMDIGWVRYVKP